MADVYGDNYTKGYVDVPSKKIAPGEQSGDTKVLYDRILLPRDVMAIGEKIYIGKLPAGVRILAATLKSVSLGTTGIMKMGTAASEEGLVAAADGDAGGQEVHAFGKGVLIGKETTQEETYYIEFTEASDAANGDLVEAWIQYVVI